MLSVKDGVKVGGIQPETILALIVVQSLFHEMRIPCVLTSAEDSSEHMPSSYHYKGLAVDIRLPSKYLDTPGIDDVIVNSIHNSLGKEYDVVLESTHIHIEYDPKPSPIT
jgi:hypothetical protein